MRASSGWAYAPKSELGADVIGEAFWKGRKRGGSKFWARLPADVQANAPKTNWLASRCTFHGAQHRVVNGDVDTLRCGRGSRTGLVGHDLPRAVEVRGDVVAGVEHLGTRGPVDTGGHVVGVVP